MVKQIEFDHIGIPTAGEPVCVPPNLSTPSARALGARRERFADGGLAKRFRRTGKVG